MQSSPTCHWIFHAIQPSTTSYPMKNKTIHRERFPLAFLLIWALMLPRAVGGSWTVSVEIPTDKPAGMLAPCEPGPAAYASLPANSPHENWAQTEADGTDSDNEHRCLPSSALELGLVAVLIRRLPARMISLPSPSPVAPHRRC